MSASESGSPDGLPTEDPNEPFPSPAVVRAVTRHMNEDHADDTVLICRSLGHQPATNAATMTGMDALGIDLLAIVEGHEVPVRIPFAQRLGERAQVRPEIVRMYHEACVALGVEPRPEAPDA